MAKITTEYITSAFYRNFYRATLPEQNGIIRGLETVRDCKASDEESKDEAPLLNGCEVGDAQLP